MTRTPTYSAMWRLVVTLAMERVPPAEIARRVGRPRQTVYHYLAQARRDGIAIPAYARQGLPPQPIFWEVAPDVAAGLLEPARRRGLTPQALVAEVVGAVVRDGLLDAVLDDGGAP